MTTILSVAYPFAPVGDDPVGGAEQVLANLDRAIAAQRWTSLVIACEGSRPKGELIAVPRVVGDIGEAERARIHGSLREAIGRTLATRAVDLIHLHGIDFDAYLPPPGPPVLATLHLPLDWYGQAALHPQRAQTWLQPVSASQAAAAPSDIALTQPIENGVDVDAFQFPPTPRRLDAASSTLDGVYMDRRLGGKSWPGKRPFALCLGRICPEKGFHLALDAAKSAGVPLKIAGEVFPYPVHQAYFADQIAPRLDEERRFIGPVQGRCKRRLMAAARCVLIPSLAAETSSLVAREAAAAGTPVVAFRNGALSHTVEDGRTGFLVDTVADMAEAIGRVESIDPCVCRAVARSRFALARMSEAYLDLYRRLIAAAEHGRAA